tara:strand:+ start:1134 stop:1574 length:441 start_codon:yes stop_codon:yes gene_type:complete
MSDVIKVVVCKDWRVSDDVNPWRYIVKKGLPSHKTIGNGGRIGASWDNLNHVEAVELFMIEMDLDLTHNFTIDAGEDGDDLFSVTIKPKKYTTDYDIEFSVKHDLDNPDDITAEMMIEALEERLEDIKSCNVSLEAFGQGETFENY